MTGAARTAACVPGSRGALLAPMRRLAATVVTAMLGLSASAWAQVTVDLHALDALPQPRTAPRPAHRPLTHRPLPSTAGRPSPEPAPPAAAPAVAPAPPSVAAGPPPAAVELPSAAPVPPPPATPAPPTGAVPPAAAPPAAPPQPPPAAPLVLRVGFAPGQSDLAAPEAGAVARLGREAPRTDATRIEVVAYAPASGGDASSARRLSLARALAVRAALVGAGVPAASIYVRALGVPPVDQAGAADAAIVTVMGTSGAAAAPKQGKQP